MITVLAGEGVVPEALYVNIWLVQVRFTALAFAPAEPSAPSAPFTPFAPLEPCTDLAKL